MRFWGSTSVMLFYDVLVFHHHNFYSFILLSALRHGESYLTAICLPLYQRQVPLPDCLGSFSLFFYTIGILSPTASDCRSWPRYAYYVSPSPGIKLPYSLFFLLAKWFSRAFPLLDVINSAREPLDKSASKMHRPERLFSYIIGR